MNPPTINFQYFFDQRMVELFVTTNALPGKYGFNAAELPVTTMFNGNKITMRAFVLCELNKDGKYEVIYFTSLN